MRLSVFATFVLILCVCARSAETSEPKETKEPTQPKNPEVVLETTEGTFVVRVFADKAPASAKNFLRYVEEGFYNGLVFHRVIKGFMIQGGGFTPDLQRKPTHEPIENESSNALKNRRGTLAMARTRAPNSATSQFFVNLVDNAFLDHKASGPAGNGYCVFAEVVSGMDVVDKIAATTTQCPSKTREPCTAALPPGMRDVPAQPVLIKKAHKR